MKTKFIKLLIVLSIIVANLLLTGCRTLQSKDFNPSNRQLSVRIPALEPLIDTYSFDRAYNKLLTNQGMYSGMQQMYTRFFMNDATSIFLKDVKQNISNNLPDNNGYIVCRVLNNKAKQKEFWFYLGAILGCAPWILGAPIQQYEGEVWIEVDVRNIKNELISTYKGHGKYIVTNGLYYGFSMDGSYFRKPIIESVKRALDEVKQKMSLDCNSITLALNKSMDEIQKERTQSAKESAIEPDNFLEGNKKFNEKDYAASVELYNSVLTKYPYHIYAMVNRARANSALSDNVAAIKDLTRVIELDPKNAEAFYYRGVANGNLLELNTAVYNYNKAIELSPDMVQAYLMRAAAEEDLTLNSKAIIDYQKVLSLNPNLVYAKERINIVQSRINQNIAQQQQVAEQDRINRLNAINTSLNALSNTLNTVNNINNTTRTSTTTTTQESNKKNGHIEKVTCTYCKGTGVSSYPSQGTCYGVESYHFCKECNKTVACQHGPHLRCNPCQGKGYTEKFVP